MWAPLLQLQRTLRIPALVPAVIAFRPVTTMAQTAIVNIPTLNKQITVPTGLFINNEFVPSADSTEFIQYVYHVSDQRSPVLTTLQCLESFHGGGHLFGCRRYDDICMCTCRTPLSMLSTACSVCQGHRLGCCCCSAGLQDHLGKERHWCRTIEVDLQAR
jgi:hypothetical protein